MFDKDVKALKKKHVDLRLLIKPIRAIMDNDRAYDDFYRRVALKLMMAVASSYPPSRGLPGRMSVASSFSAVPMAISYIFS